MPSSPTSPPSSPLAPATPDAIESTILQPSAAGDSQDATVGAEATTGGETVRERSRRHGRRARLYGYAMATVALAAVVIALAASNTAKTKVSWIIGSSHVSLVWMVLATAVLGWALGLVTAAVLRRRTRAPH